MQVLRDFGSGKVSIRQVDSVLSDIIRTPKTTFLDDAITYTELLFSSINTHVSSINLVYLKILFLRFLNSDSLILNLLFYRGTPALEY